MRVTDALNHMNKSKLIRVVALIFATLMLTSCGVMVKSDNAAKVSDASADLPTDADVTTASCESTDAVGVSGSGDVRLKFLAAGDNLIHECVYLDAMSIAAGIGGAAEYSFAGMYENIAPSIGDADIAFVNQEGPLCPKYPASGYPNFNAPVEAGDTLVDLGFNVVNLANNHMLDMDTASRTGLLDTIDYWKSKDVLTIGGYTDTADYNNIRILEVRGVRIAFLSYVYNFLENQGTSLSTASPTLVIPVTDDATIKSQIADAKTKADIVLVSMHWGIECKENQFSATTEQKRLAALVADCGADAIIGHHSHTVQPVEWVNGKNGNKTLVIYSLGNLISTMLNPYNMVGGIATFDIVKTADGEAYIDQLTPRYKPVVCHYESNKSTVDSLGFKLRHDIKLYWLDDYTDTLAACHGANAYGTVTVAKLRKYVTDTVAAQFLG